MKSDKGDKQNPFQFRCLWKVTDTGDKLGLYLSQMSMKIDKDKPRTYLVQMPMESNKCYIDTESLYFRCLCKVTKETNTE